MASGSDRDEAGPKSSNRQSTDGPAAVRRAGDFFGRRKAKALKPRQQVLFRELLPKLLVDISRPAPHNLSELFSKSTEHFRLEIGFGGGEHLIHEAIQSPETGFFGVEPFVNGMAKALSAIDETPLHNIRLFDEDAARLLDWLPPGQISRIDLLYPDPWPKRRHWKRRFVSPANLDRIARLLKPGGEFRFASDIAHYVNWTLVQCRAHRHFEWTAQKAGDWNEPWEGWPGTRYEAKAIREGRRPAYLIFRKI